jgi:hypothetical protein
MQSLHANRSVGTIQLAATNKNKGQYKITTSTSRALHMRQSKHLLDHIQLYQGHRQHSHRMQPCAVSSTSNSQPYKRRSQPYQHSFASLVSTPSTHIFLTLAEPTSNKFSNHLHKLNRQII